LYSNYENWFKYDLNEKKIMIYSLQFYSMLGACKIQICFIVTSSTRCKGDIVRGLWHVGRWITHFFLKACFCIWTTLRSGCVKMNSPSDGSRVTLTYVLNCMEMTCGQLGDKSSSFLKLPYFLLSHLLFFPCFFVYLIVFSSFILFHF
jgi:hypothetical protein